MGFEVDEIGEDAINEALNTAHLSDLIENLPEGIKTQVGDRGAKLSGGQRQRLGIARALISHPKLLVLDEATSALDAQSELEISNAILKLKGDTTMILVAHRLSTVRNADLVVYMSGGKILATGTFDEVRNAIPHFDVQAKLLGI